MTDRCEDQTELTQEFNLAPGLAGAISKWYKARYAFQHERCRQHQDAYDAATNELGQAFSVWSAQLPEFFPQLRLWLNSHPED